MNMVLIGSLMLGMVLFLALKVINAIGSQPVYAVAVFERLIVMFLSVFVALPVLVIILFVILHYNVPVLHPVTQPITCAMDRVTYSALNDDIDGPFGSRFVDYPACDENLDLTILNEVCAYNLPYTDGEVTVSDLQKYCPKGWDEYIWDTYLYKDYEVSYSYLYSAKEAREKWKKLALNRK